MFRNYAGRDDTLSDTLILYSVHLQDRRTSYHFCWIFRRKRTQISCRKCSADAGSTLATGIVTDLHIQSTYVRGTVVNNIFIIILIDFLS